MGSDYWIWIGALIGVVIGWLLAECQKRSSEARTQKRTQDIVADSTIPLIAIGVAIGWVEAKRRAAVNGK